MAYLGHRSNFDSSNSSESEITAQITVNDNKVEVSGSGNGPLSAFKNALENQCQVKVNLVDYQEHAVGAGADATAAAYVEIETANRQAWWGVGIDSNIVTASFHALISAINRSETASFT